MKILVPAIAIAFSAVTAAYAGGHTGNSAEAASMVANIQAYGGDIAPLVGGQGAFDQGPGQRGWGNAGSLLTGNGTVDTVLGTDLATEGGQVSKSGKPAD